MSDPYGRFELDMSNFLDLDAGGAPGGGGDAGGPPTGQGPADRP